jgi:hypothetical protein
MLLKPTNGCHLRHYDWSELADTFKPVYTCTGDGIICSEIIPSHRNLRARVNHHEEALRT